VVFETTMYANSITLRWSPPGDLNPHTFRHYGLNVARLPFRQRAIARSFI
jgi:hypothetical protein